jgi:hypothetical protein
LYIFNLLDRLKSVIIRYGHYKRGALRTFPVSSWHEPLEGIKHFTDGDATSHLWITVESVSGSFLDIDMAAYQYGVTTLTMGVPVNVWKSGEDSNYILSGNSDYDAAKFLALYPLMVTSIMGGEHVESFFRHQIMADDTNPRLLVKNSNVIREAIGPNFLNPKKEGRFADERTNLLKFPPLDPKDPYFSNHCGWRLCTNKAPGNLMRCGRCRQVYCSSLNPTPGLLL